MAKTEAKQHKPRSIAETLERAYHLIKPAKRWIKYHAFSYNDDGQTIGYCSLGALSAVGGRFEDRAIEILQSAIPAASLISRDVPSFNDDISTTHRDVLALFRRAIKKARA